MTQERYEKSLRRPLGDGALVRLQALAGWRGRAGDVSLRAVEYLPWSDPHVLVMERVRGVGLGEIIARAGRAATVSPRLREALGAAELAGAWLAAFHAFPAEAPLEPWDAPARIAAAEANVKALVSLGLSGGLADRLLMLADADADAAVDGGQPVTIHGDFKPDNLMLAGEELIGVDMEGYHRGSSLVDLGQFLAALYLARSGCVWGNGRPETWRRLGAAFLRSYRAGGGTIPPGLTCRMVECLCGELVRLAARGGALFWCLRGRRLMLRTLQDLTGAEQIAPVGTEAADDEDDDG